MQGRPLNSLAIQMQQRQVKPYDFDNEEDEDPVQNNYIPIDFLKGTKFKAIDSEALRDILSEEANDTAHAYLGAIEVAFAGRASISFSSTRPDRVSISDFGTFGRLPGLLEQICSHDPCSDLQTRALFAFRELTEAAARFHATIREAHARVLIDIVLKYSVPSGITVDLERPLCLNLVDKPNLLHGPVDYALMSGNNLVGLVEAKRSLQSNSSLAYAEAQLFLQLLSTMWPAMEDHDDSLNVKSTWGVLTSGTYWAFYLFDQNGCFGKFASYDLVDGDGFRSVAEVIHVLHTLLSTRIIQGWLNEELRQQIQAKCEELDVEWRG